MKPADAIGAFEDAARSLQSICSTSYPSQISRAVDLLVERFSAGNKLLVCGNGGSAADSQHLAAEDRAPAQVLTLPAKQIDLDALEGEQLHQLVENLTQ